MNSSNVGGTNAIKNLIRILLIVIVLVGVYYLYKYLFTSSGLDIYELNSEFKPATGISAAVAKDFPKQVFSGGELSVNIWVYFQDLRAGTSGFGSKKHIFTLGKATSGSGNNITLAGEQTMVAYLDENSNTMKVAVATESTSGMISGNTNEIPTSAISNVHATINNIEFQKWIMLTFTLNNKILDIYMDGKLARSVVLPAMYKVGSPAQDALYLTAAAYGGFGGYIGNVKMANYALNPEEVWRLYMSGPSTPFTLTNWFKGLFDPEYLKNITIPGQ
jgi:hypothetical protein